jgi:hypothetical protein
MHRLRARYNASGEEVAGAGRACEGQFTTRNDAMVAVQLPVRPAHNCDEREGESVCGAGGGGAGFAQPRHS